MNLEREIQVLIKQTLQNSKDNPLILKGIPLSLARIIIEFEKELMYVKTNPFIIS